MMTNTRFRRLKNGFSDLGKIQIPPRAVAFVLTDRADGTKYLVSFDSTNPEHLSITTDFVRIQKYEGVRVYTADEGPVMDEDGEYMLFVQNGHIGIEYIPFPVWERAADNAPPYARQFSAQRELLLDTLNLATLHLGYET